MNKKSNRLQAPLFRRLRGYSFDPSLSGKLDTAMINERVYTVPWEDDLQPGPEGKYIAVVDVDPASDCYYDPVNLNDPFLLAQDGLAPSAANPQFHQQMVYAVVMTTIRNFERAIGRPVMWSDRTPEDMGKTWSDMTWKDEEALFVEKLMVYPHALREANAYYSPRKKALLFGYFPATATASGCIYPEGLVFGCLSHDIIAHETTHAILDGIHPRFIEVTQPQGLAFHEAFADIVALFQHFTFHEIVRHQIAKTRGDLEVDNLLGQLAQEFGRATGNHGSLRDALGSEDADGKWVRRRPDPTKIHRETEPHALGAILVSAVFDAFVTIYNARIQDLKRIASEGTGILREGELHPDLVNRLASEAVKVAEQVLNMCIRALDYCPPVDIDFGDYLRALITADRDVVKDDSRDYRLAFIDAFRQHGIYPRNLKTLSEESLAWNDAEPGLQDYEKIATLGEKLHSFYSNMNRPSDRKIRWKAMRSQRSRLHKLLQEKFWDVIGDPQLQRLTGIDFEITKERKGEDVVRFEIHSISPVQRQRQDGTVLNQVIFSVLQDRPLDWDKPDGQRIFGGCTIIVDLDKNDGRGAIRYLIRKSLHGQEGPDGRITKARAYFGDLANTSLAATYGADRNDEPFAMLHTEF
ncbi:MAG: hypothetical protein U0903_05940 [Planctomycetales bacterium]